MHSVPTSFPSTGCTPRVRTGIRLAATVLGLGVVCGVLPVWAQVPVTVPNYSFESPSSTYVSTVITSWQKFPQPANWTAPTGSGLTWDDLAGVFKNDPPPASDNITNMDGNQAAYIFGDQGVGLYQTLTNTYQVGTSYSLTVGIVGQGGGMPDGAIVQLQFYYLNASNNMVAIGTPTTATENPANFPNHTMEYDYTVSIPAVQATDPWANKPIGIEIFSPVIQIVTNGVSSSPLGGYWDLDNVRLHSFPPAVPTPGLRGVLACFCALLSLRAFGRALQRCTR